jgi:tRNA threonylcarbamoyladenosine biosynthesis protein TsaE
MPTADSDRHGGVTLRAASAPETRRIGARLAALLRSGDVVCLYGDLGAGKTTFVQGIAEGLGIAARVTSPTFTLVHEYPGGRVPLFHFDVYRLRGAADLADIGFDEYLARGGIALIEWADRITDALPGERLDAYLVETSGADEEEEGRAITLRGHGERWATFAREWKAGGGSPC